jgi:hypothetical protein
MSPSWCCPVRNQACRLCTAPAESGTQVLKTHPPWCTASTCSPAAIHYRLLNGTLAQLRHFSASRTRRIVYVRRYCVLGLEWLGCACQVVMASDSNAMSARSVMVPGAKMLRLLSGLQPARAVADVPMHWDTAGLQPVSAPFRMSRRCPSLASRHPSWPHTPWNARVHHSLFASTCIHISSIVATTAAGYALQTCCKQNVRATALGERDQQRVLYWRRLRSGGQY